MKTTKNLVRSLTCLTAALATSAALQAAPQKTADNGLAQADLDRAATMREERLLLDGPDFTLLRSTHQGEPEMRLDIYTSNAEMSRREVVELARRFSFGAENGGSKEDRGLSQAPTRARSPFTFLDIEEAPEGRPLARLFDPSSDTVVEFRDVRQDLTCSGHVAIQYSGYGYTGSSFYWSFYADMVSAVVGPDKGQWSDPDLYLYYHNGYGFSSIDSSYFASRIDNVAALNTGCYSRLWKVRVYMYRGGPFTINSVAFNAY